jgi:hypothetical protein
VDGGKKTLSGEAFVEEQESSPLKMGKWIQGYDARSQHRFIEKAKHPLLSPVMSVPSFRSMVRLPPSGRALIVVSRAYSIP